MFEYTIVKLKISFVEYQNQRAKIHVNVYYKNNLNFRMYWRTYMKGYLKKIKSWKNASLGYEVSKNFGTTKNSATKKPDNEPKP